MNDFSGQSFGRYHIIEPLGEGGMATVYKAYDTHLECEVAVKVIRTDQLSPAVLEQALKRFEREAKEVARLNHPNIVRVIDYGEHEGIPFLVMPYLSGGTLKQLLGKPIKYLNAIEIILPIARALNYAHQRKMIHRDVKPANILISDSGDVMLTDFGIVKIIDQTQGRTLTGTGVGIGTPEYMSPEQGVGKDIDERADIYSLGVVFFELTTGQKPYTADTPMAVIIKHISDPLPRPKKLVPDIPDKVEQIILKACAKDPENRYQTISNFITALEKLQKESFGKLSFESSRQTKINISVEEKDPNKTWDKLPKDTSTEEKLPKTITDISQPYRKKGIFGFFLICIFMLVILLSFFYFKNIWSVKTTETPQPPTSSNSVRTVTGSEQQFYISTPSDIVITESFSSPTLTPIPFTEHLIKAGDTCILLGVINNVSVQSIIDLNYGSIDCNSLIVGQKILIPFPTPTPSSMLTATISALQVTQQNCEIVTYQVQENDTLAKISLNYQISTTSIKTYNGLNSDNIYLGMILNLPLCERQTTPPIGTTRIEEKDGMTQVYIPAGIFTMGSEGLSIWEEPIHEVFLDAFWMDQIEVTNEMYEKCVNEGVCTPPKYSKSSTRVEYFGNPLYGNYPVIFVDWNQAKTYCSWAGRQLPSEEQWEKAARGTDQRKYPWGSELNCSLANNVHCNGDTVAVGNYESGKSFYGIFDMAGNVSEWVIYSFKNYPQSLVENPHNENIDTEQVVRGGGWGSYADTTQSASRIWYPIDETLKQLGFRCASNIKDSVNN